MSFRELKTGIRDGRYRQSTRLQQFMLLTGGFFVGLFALVLLIGLVLRPLGLLAAGALLGYITFQMTRAMWRA